MLAPEDIPVKLESGLIEVDAPGGKLPAYLAYPAAATLPLPGVVVVQELWGVDEHIEDIAGRIAAAGYAALAPDLYARGGERPPALARERLAAVKRFVDAFGPSVFRDPLAREAALARKPADERRPLSESFTLLSVVRGESDALVDLVAAAASHLRGGPSRGERVGAVGFCMGGDLVGLLAVTDPGLAAAAAFYGTPPPADRLATLSASFEGFYGGPDKDPRVTSTVPAFEKAAREAGRRVECHIYRDAPHAFMNDTRPSYHVAAARDAWARMLGLFARELAQGR